jgi:Holliday junction resolvase RusA-like endonuclease
MLKIKIDEHALPLNRLYPSSASGRRFLSKEGSDFKKIVSLKTRQCLLQNDFKFNPETQYISTEFYFYTPKLLTKAGKINKKKPDTSNCIKALEDAIFETLGVDDCYNLDVTASVFYAEKPSIIVILRTHILSAKFDSLLP